MRCAVWWREGARPACVSSRIWLALIEASAPPSVPTVPPMVPPMPPMPMPSILLMPPAPPQQEAEPAATAAAAAAALRSAARVPPRAEDAQEAEPAAHAAAAAAAAVKWTASALPLPPILLRSSAPRCGAWVVAGRQDCCSLRQGGGRCVGWLQPPPSQRGAACNMWGSQPP